MADGLVILETLPDRDGHFADGIDWEGERIFSRELGCPVHGPQVLDMAPRNFSFNSPYGACPECKGLGTVPEVDESRLVPDPTMSLRQGAVVPWKWFFSPRGDRAQELMLESCSHARQLHQIVEDYKIDVRTAWQDLTNEQRGVLLYGVEWTGVAAKKRRGKVDVSGWQGIVGRIRERMELADDGDEYERLQGYLCERPCPACHGARLNRESLAVSIRGKNISEVCRLHINEAADFFKDL
jgi:excinuclease ABC subunit A